MQDGQKLSSACLEYCLQTNLPLTSTYLIQDYYPRTSIDTEFIVKNAIVEVKKKQRKLLYSALKKSRGHTWENMQAPLIYQAQSLNDIFIMFKLQAEPLDTGCPASFDEILEVSHQFVSLAATCYDFEASTQMEDAVIMYKSVFKLDRGVVESQSTGQWIDESTFELRLRKEDAPSYWPSIILHAVDESDLRVGIWNSQQRKFNEQL